ncbi:hypothetical protein ACH47B_32380 [Rhodococcus sp. NPDC019627]
MTPLTQIAGRYRAAAVLARAEIALYAVADDAGAQLDAALRRLIARLREEDPEVWQDLLAMARQLRWRLATNPAPPVFRVGEDELVAALGSACDRRIRGADETTQLLLSDLADRAERAHLEDRPTGAVLLESLAEVNYESCVVVTASGRTQDATRQWFGELGIAVPVLCATFREQAFVVEQAYAVGSPSLFGPGLLSAPRASELAYVLPSWVQDRTLPVSPISDYAEGAIRPRRKVFTIGAEPVLAPVPVVVGDQLVPQPSWSPQAPSRPPRPGEVLARKVFLGGGLAIMLDQAGEHIRTLHPQRPPGQRVDLSDVSALTVGSYLVLREGSTVSEMLYDRAIELLGARGSAARASQAEWKAALRRELDRMGTRTAIQSLAQAGVTRADRAPAWTSTTMVRPQNGNDFVFLLRWLGMPKEPHYELATSLRRARLQASQDIREILEEAISTADLAGLDRDGFLRLELNIPGFRSMIATRVLAISPNLEPVHRGDIRRPSKDRSAQWLE